MKKLRNLEYYVLTVNLNGELEVYNIFTERLEEEIEKAIGKYVDFSSFKERLAIILKSKYLSRVEYECLMSDISDKKKYKTDIWKQIEPNLELIARYIIGEYNKNLGG